MPRAENAAQHASTVADIAKKYRPAVPCQAWGTLWEMNEPRREFRSLESKGTVARICVETETRGRKRKKKMLYL